MLASGLATEEWETLIPEKDRLAAAKLCVELGNSVTAANRVGTTALHAAAYLGVNAVADFLLDRGAVLNARNARGETPLHIAQGYTVHLTVTVHDKTADLLRQRGGVADGGIAGE